MLKSRPFGQETPFIKAGIFKIRIPFIHYRFEWPDYIQGLLMCAVDLAAIPLMAELLGMPFAVALAVVMLNGMFYLVHHLMGDPVVPGWITPAIPLIMAYCAQFAEGEMRVFALIAFQLTLGAFSIGLGATGMARKMVGLIPPAIKSGVIIGAGMAAVMAVFKEGGRFDLYPWSITICVGAAFYLIFSTQFQTLKNRYAWAALLAKLGVFPVIMLALVVGPICGEVAWSKIEWGISQPDFMGLWQNYTVFGLGFPPISMFVAAIPTVLATYIVLFGDILQSKAILAEGDQVRTDEKIDYDPNRSHLLFGARNFVMSFLGPDITMCGPLWAAMQVVVVERYKAGRKAMDSIFGGSGSFRWGTNTGLLLLPIVTLLQPILGIALALTLLIQGFVSVRIGVMESRSQRDLGIAGVVAAVLALKGAAWAFGVGLVLCLLIYGRKLFSGESDDTIGPRENGPNV